MKMHEREQNGDQVMKVNANQEGRFVAQNDNDQVSDIIGMMVSFGWKPEYDTHNNLVAMRLNKQKIKLAEIANR